MNVVKQHRKKQMLFSMFKEATKYETEANYPDTLNSDDNIAELVKEKK